MPSFSSGTEDFTTWLNCRKHSYLIGVNNEHCLCFQVEAVPTVLAIKDGKIVGKFIGLKDDEELKSFVNRLTGEWHWSLPYNFYISMTVFPMA